MVGKRIDTFEVMFWGDKDEAIPIPSCDVIDGLQSHGDQAAGRDVKSQEPGNSCPAANARWNLHYPTPAPEKTSAKVTFQCGEGVDQYHEIDHVEVEADCSGSTMTCMELQKLMEERKKRPNGLCSKDAPDSDLEDM
nr:hypothetical protein BaRGS_012749 [Batillaria attramentaria]